MMEMHTNTNDVSINSNEIDHNLGQSTCRHFHVLVQLSFATCRTKQDYYHQKVPIRVASQVTERRKT